MALSAPAAIRDRAASRRPRGPRLLLAAVALALVVASAAVDLPAVSGREFWGDGATYYAMAWSLARDLDLRYTPEDLARIEAEYPAGPQGVFLKRAAGGLTFDRSAGFPWLRRVTPREARLYYAKAFAYPLAAAPFVALLGTRGLMLLNGLLLALALWLGSRILERRGFDPWPACLGALSLLLLSVTPLYVVWPTPEVFGLVVVIGGLAAWAAGRPLLSAVLFGLAGYLKPPNVLMAAPLGLEPLLAPAGQRLTAPDLVAGVKEMLRRGVVLGATAASLYAVNLAVTGELNYQGGGERKTFYGRFPYDDKGTSFDTAGVWMTTNQLGPLVAGTDDAAVDAQTGPARRSAELLETFAWNLGYFWVGRFGGALAYFLPAVLAAALFLLLGPRDRAGWLALAAVVLSWLVYIRYLPDNWYGGGGTVGNRYFLNILPAFLFLVPRARWRLVVAGGVLGAVVFLAPVLASPVHHSLRPGEHTLRAVFRPLPAELTMLNDLSVFTETWRKKRPYGFVGNAQRHADADAFFLYFLDDGTYGKEEWAGRAGFWLRGSRPAEVVLRAFDLAPVEQVVLRIVGGPMGDVVDARLGWHGERVRLGPGEAREITLPAGHGVPYYDTYLFVLKLRSQRAASLPDGRSAGSFVEPRLVVGPRAAAR